MPRVQVLPDTGGSSPAGSYQGSLRLWYSSTMPVRDVAWEWLLQRANWELELLADPNPRAWLQATCAAAQRLCEETSGTHLVEVSLETDTVPLEKIASLAEHNLCMVHTWREKIVRSRKKRVPEKEALWARCRPLAEALRELIAAIPIEPKAQKVPS